MPIIFATNPVNSASSSNAFTVIQTPAGTSPTATSSASTLTLTSTDGSVTITGNSATNTVDFSVSGTSVGGFTTGSVIFAGATGKLAQDNAKFFWDDTNFRLGLSTATPSTDLAFGNNNGTARVIAIENATGSDVGSGLTLRSASGVTASTGTAGGALTASAGSGGVGSGGLGGAGGTITETAGSAGNGTTFTTGSTGASATLSGGSGGGAGGAIALLSGTGAASPGGTGGGGGAISLTGGTGGTGTTGGTGGAASLVGGAAAASAGSAGGAVSVTGAAGTSTGTGGAGGAASLVAGNAGGDNTTNRVGGALTITAGTSKGSSVGGAIAITAGVGGVGTSATGAIGGALTLSAGTGGANTTGGAGADVTIQAGAQGSGGSAGGGKIVFQTAATTSLTTAMTISNAGMVGINVTPTSPLHVNPTWVGSGVKTVALFNASNTDNSFSNASTLLDVQYKGVSQFMVNWDGSITSTVFTVSGNLTTLRNLTVKSTAAAPPNTAWTNLKTAGADPILNLYKSDDTVIFTSTPGGLIGIGPSAGTGAQLEIDSPATGTKVLLLKAIASQTANMLEVQNSSATVLANITNDGYIQYAGQSRVSTQFDATTNTTLANVTGLTVNVSAGKTYQFQAVLYVDAAAVGGSKYAIAGTATATAIIYEILLVDNTSNSNTITSRQTALAGASGQAGTTAGFCRITGLITVNAAGTLTVQFAQNVSNGTSSVLVGSNFVVQQIT